MLTHTVAGIGVMFLLLAQAAERLQSPPKTDSARPQNPEIRRNITARGPRPSSRTEDHPMPKEVLNAQFQATVYEVQVTTGRLKELRSGAMAARAATAEELLHALSDLGTARILYRIDQPVNIYGERISITSEEPMVTAARRMPNGQVMNSVQYQQVGIIVQLAARPSPEESGRKGPDVSLALEVSAITASNVEIASGIKAPITQSLSLEHSEGLEYNQPRVALLVDATKSDKQTPATMYAVRYLFAPLADR